MSNVVWRKIKAWEKRYRARYSHDIVDPDERRRSLFYNDYVDHGILRYRWHNFEEIAPGIYRSNHPNHDRFERYKAMGITTILNLRGATIHSHYRFEVESCEKLGLRLIDIALSARRAPSVDLLLQVLDTLDSLDGPTLMHCKSGADRTGLVSAIYYLHVLNRPVEEAKKMMSFRFLHLKFTSTGILDYIIDLYGKRQREGAISFRDWVETEYDQAAVKDAFDNLGFWDRLRL